MSNIEEKKVDNVEEQQVEDQAASNPTSQEDIFAEVFGQANEEQFVATVEPQPEIVEESQPSEVQDTSDPKNDSDSYQYWQSQSDKKQVEIDTLKGQMSEMMTRINVSDNTSASAKEETVNLEKPVKPRKPGDYDHSEALADPDSDSGKYLVKQEQYLDNLTNYMTNVEERREQKALEQQRDAEKFQRNQKVISDLQTKHGYDVESANDFVEKMSSPDSLSLDNLVKLHKMSMGNAPQQVTSPTNIEQVTPEAQQKQALMQSRQEKLSIPKPIGVQPGASVQSSKSVEDLMMDSMVGNYKKKNPF